MQDMSNTQHQLDQIKVDILKKNVCPDLAKTAQQLVMGAGDPDANIMFIGEAPGKKEDETGLPFVGAAGKFLDEMLASVGMHRDQVFITSIVKYRPPNNRDPKPEEKAAFLPYLLQQIAIIQPTVIVPLGRHGMEYFLPGVRISDIHGQLQEIEFEGRTLKVMPLYHPAAALYNGSMRQTWKDDFLKLTQLLEAA